MDGFLPVIILAGGLGTRISAAYPDLPKSLIPINGEPFIAHQLRLLARESVSEVILCVGHLSDRINAYVGSGKDFGITVSYSNDIGSGGDLHDGGAIDSSGTSSNEGSSFLLGTGGAVLKAVQNINGPFAVLYGDSYLDTKFAHIKKAFDQAKKPGLMTVYKNNNQWDKSNIVIESGLVVDYDKSKIRSDMQYIDYGLSIFDKSAFKSFETKAFDLNEVLSLLISKKQLAAYEVKERFYEIGSPAGIEELQIHLQSLSI